MSSLTSGMAVIMACRCLLELWDEWYSRLSRMTLKSGSPSLPRSHGLGHLERDQRPLVRHAHEAEHRLFTIPECAGSRGHRVLLIAQEEDSGRSRVGQSLAYPASHVWVAYFLEVSQPYRCIVPNDCEQCLSLGFIAVKKHQDHCNSYKGQHLIGAGL